MDSEIDRLAKEDPSRGDVPFRPRGSTLDVMLVPWVAQVMRAGTSRGSTSTTLRKLGEL